MTDAFQAVARGLRIAHAGFLLTCWGATSAAVLIWIISNTHYGPDYMRLVLWGGFWLNVLIGVGGVIVGIVGRVRCLKAPHEIPAVRGRALAAGVLEGCGWLSLFVGVGVFFPLGFGGFFPAALWVPGVGLGFSVILLVCGRVMFLRFLYVLARAVEDKSSALRAQLSSALFLADWGVVMLGAGIAAAGSVLRVSELSTPLAFFVWILTGMSGLAGLVLYDRVLGGLTRSVRAFADTHRDDEEERYRSRNDDDEPDQEGCQSAGDSCVC